MSPRLKQSLLITLPLVLVAAGTVAYAIWVLAGEPEGTASLSEWVYNAAIAFAGLACLGRAAVTRELRGAWIAFGIGLLAWAAGDVYWTEVLSDLRPRDVPYPSWADVGYLAALPCFFVGIALLIKRRVGRFTAASWFDGAIGALASAALATAILSPALIGLTKGEPTAVMTNLAYPLGDMLLIAFLTGALVVGGVRGARSLLLVGAGLIVWAGADVAYLYLIATDAYAGGPIDLLWPLGAMLIAMGAWFSNAGQAHQKATYRSSLVLPAAFTLIVTAILVWDHFDRQSALSVWLAGATNVAVVVRLAMSFRENDRLVAALHGDSTTDALTGLANRRQLFADLEGVLAQGDASPRTIFALFDLDGFKSYNDGFGHPAGDALLQRLGKNLATALRSLGTAYRLGGDEFCILVELGERKPASLVEMARAALAEEGEGFSISASGGWILLPDEATNPGTAVNEVDQRMYAEKNQDSSRSSRQTQEVLMRVFREREPALSTHVAGVARLALTMGRRLQLDSEELDVLSRAAELHDLGKIAIPDEVLSKPGPLDENEWSLMRRHTLIGHRILDATPAMKPVAQLVRSSHERWDGAGYPDGLSGADIPLGARIIFVCDSVDAMTSDRPYRAARTIPEVIQELRRCAGTQFDPDLAELLCEILGSGELEPTADGPTVNGRPVVAAPVPG
jgi:two-component system cell cycle response regulator